MVPKLDAWSSWDGSKCTGCNRSHLGHRSTGHSDPLLQSIVVTPNYTIVTKNKYMICRHLLGFRKQLCKSAHTWSVGDQLTADTVECCTYSHHYTQI